jgi:hypothetical protein
LSLTDPPKERKSILKLLRRQAGFKNQRFHSRERMYHLNDLKPVVGTPTKDFAETRPYSNRELVDRATVWESRKNLSGRREPDMGTVEYKRTPIGWFIQRLLEQQNRL